jgi:hypothetical protein
MFKYELTRADDTEEEDESSRPKTFKPIDGSTEEKHQLYADRAAHVRLGLLQRLVR